MSKFRPVDWFLKSSRLKKKTTALLPYFWKHTSSDRSANDDRIWHEVRDLKFDGKKLKSFVRSLDERSAAKELAARGKILSWELTSSKNLKKKMPSKTEAVHPTKNCFGYALEVIMQLGLEGYFASSAKILQLEAGAETDFRRTEYDPFQPQAYQLLISIESNSSSKIEWRTGKKIKTIRLPKDGDAYLINVSEPHRIANRSKNKPSSVFICSLNLY